MSWPFCPACGTVLDPPEFDEVKCTFCQFHSKFKSLLAGEVITKLPARQPQPWAKDVDNDEEDNEMDKHAIIQEPCPKCAYPEMYFYTMQLRSVDEGSTVFYECPKCTHKYSINN